MFTLFKRTQVPRCIFRSQSLFCIWFVSCRISVLYPSDCVRLVSLSRTVEARPCIGPCTSLASSRRARRRQEGRARLRTVGGTPSASAAALRDSRPPAAAADSRLPAAAPAASDGRTYASNGCVFWSGWNQILIRHRPQAIRL